MYECSNTSTTRPLWCTDQAVHKRLLSLTFWHCPLETRITCNNIFLSSLLGSKMDSINTARFSHTIYFWEKLVKYSTKDTIHGKYITCIWLFSFDKEKKFENVDTIWNMIFKQPQCLSFQVQIFRTIYLNKKQGPVIHCNLRCYMKPEDPAACFHVTT